MPRVHYMRFCNLGTDSRRGGMWRPITILAVAVLVCVTACRQQPVAQSQPTSAPAPALKLIAAESRTWSHDEACAHLADEKLGLSAAIRLIRLAGLTPLCLPANLTDEWLAGLQLLRLNDACWALGVRDRRSERRLRAPLLITTTGEPRPLAEDVAEELPILHIARDADVFPHLAILPDRVILIEDEPLPALMLQPGPAVRFELRTQDGFPYVALLLCADNREVTRYVWDPYEAVFTGPAADELPDPPGGKFSLDMEASPLLVPIGGQLPEPKALPEHRELPPVHEDLLPV